jgi:hypothetical protein
VGIFDHQRITGGSTAPLAARARQVLCIVVLGIVVT